jgi:O-methyltransferase involved in polyketide biosynthesis
MEFADVYGTPPNAISMCCASPMGWREAGFDDSRSAFFSWLGVTQYLTRPAIDATLKVVAALPSPSTIVLSFMVPDVDLPSEEAAAARTVAEHAAGRGEPWITRMSSQELTSRLTRLGFREVVHLSPEDANSRYFGGRRDGLRAPHVAQLMAASNVNLPITFSGESGNVH